MPLLCTILTIFLQQQSSPKDAPEEIFVVGATTELCDHPFNCSYTAAGIRLF
jgi:hypothetical protein